ncbi:hypothetical protein FRB94_000366, partial [Tulasnella sp. JGI-2019a]
AVLPNELETSLNANDQSLKNSSDRKVADILSKRSKADRTRHSRVNDDAPGLSCKVDGGTDDD